MKQHIRYSRFRLVLSGLFVFILMLYFCYLLIYGNSTYILIDEADGQSTSLTEAGMTKRKQIDLVHKRMGNENRWKENSSLEIRAQQQHRNITNNQSNWMILLTINDGFWDFFSNWFWYFGKLNITVPVIVVAEDEVVFHKLKSFHSDIFQVERDHLTSVNKAAKYGSAEFKKLVSSRPKYILKYLNRGTNILFVDIDAVWLKDPFQFLMGQTDMWIQLDSPDNYCTGFMAIKSNPRTIEFMKHWETELEGHDEIDQAVFNRIIANASIQVVILNFLNFPSGREYFDEFTDFQRSEVAVVHNNWILGHTAKLKRFKKFNLWFGTDGSEEFWANIKLYAVAYLIVFIVLSASVLEIRAMYTQ